LFGGGKCSFSPEDTTHRGRVIVCDFPLLEYGHETGRTINIILKLIFQRAWLRRSISESPNVVWLWQDEFQYFVTRRVNFFQQTCRGSRVAVVCLTQNLLNLSEELGEAQPGSKTKSFCGNLAIKIAHQQNETDTASFMSDVIGKEYRYLDSFHAGGAEAGQAHASVGGSKQLVHILEPIEFQRLTKPSAENPYAEAIVYQSGKHFNTTKTDRNPKGRNYIRVLFSRE
jgi:type IV secretory pathway TraG/TraD family ATPase VirD4